MAPDFTAAAEYLRQARLADDLGDEAKFVASRHLVLIALGLPMPVTFDQQKRVNHPCG